MDEDRKPMALDLEEFMRLLPHLDAADLMSISATYEEGDAEAREAARASASAIANRRGLLDQLGRIQGSIIQWAGSDISRSSQYTMEAFRTNPMLGDIRMQAVPPLLDAATALLLDRFLAEEDRELLLDPLTAVVG
jgi:hypothetical protein